MATTKGFIKDFNGNILLPITRAELILDSLGNKAFNSDQFLATDALHGLMNKDDKKKLDSITLDDQGNINIDLSQYNSKLLEIDNKLNYINSGLRVGNETLNFYDSTTPYSQKFIDLLSNTIDIISNNNQVNFNLKEILETEINLSNEIIKNITVDKYGRVTSISSGTLNNNDLPNEISNKILQGCTTTISSGEQTYEGNIANISYVDYKFQTLLNIANGSQVFAGFFNGEEDLDQLLVESNLNKYYKVTKSSTITKDKLHELNNDITTDIGDTLIIWKDPENESNGIRFVYVPSGDDQVITTSLNIYNGGASPIGSNLSQTVNIDFSKPFIVSKDENSKITISLPKVDNTTDGYLSKDDYAKFSGYSSIIENITGQLNNLNVSYESNSEITPNYTLGKLKVGTNSYDIKGIRDTYELTLAQNSNVPTLQFSFNSENKANIGFTGVGNISITKDGDNIKLNVPSYTSASANQLYINSNEIGITLGSLETPDGLVTYNTVRTLITSNTHSFEIIENSLMDINQTYHYGSESMKTAVAYG